MSIQISPGSPLAESLRNAIQPKLAEAGWATDGVDDLALAEYIVLLLVNGKTQHEVASEMAADFLSLDPEDEGVMNFSRWLFEQVDLLNKQLNGGSQTDAGTGNGADSTQAGQATSTDAEMGDVVDAEGGSIPTGPKAMRNGSGNGAQKPRDKRMLGQLNKAMDRSSDAALHRVRNGSGTGRVTSHSREPPRGPRNQQLGRGVAAMANGRGMGQMGIGGMNGMPGMSGMPMPPMGPNGPVMTPQQQMALYQMYEQQAQMMQQLFSGQPAPSAFVNPNFHGNNPQAGKSLFDRVDTKSARFNDKRQQHHNKFPKRDAQDVMMTDGGDSGANGEPKDPTQTRCRFDLTCTKADCTFVHQSPAALPGTSIDFNDTCSYGAACMNKKCVGKHPSPAQRDSHKAETDCIFYPNCRDPANCPFRHPDMPPCRNGADCTVPDCKFAHNKVVCRFTPCTKSGCPFKHAEGQKKNFADMQWTANRNGSNGEFKKEHVSERKFVADETAEEELILPGKSSQEETGTQIIT